MNDTCTQWVNGVPVDELIDWDSDPLTLLIAREEADERSFDLA